MGARFSMPEKVSQAEMARRWGVKRSRISQYKTDRAIKIQETETTVAEAAGSVEPPPKTPAVSETQGKGPAVVVARLARAENVAWKMYDYAVTQNQVAKVAALAKNYHAAAAARITAEKDLIEYQIKVRDLMPLPESIELLGKILAPIKSQLVALPYSASPRANPADPDLAREAISAETEKMKEQIIAALENLKPC